MIVDFRPDIRHRYTLTLILLGWPACPTLQKARRVNGVRGICYALPGVLEAAEALRKRKDIAFFFAGSGAQRATVEKIVQDRQLANVRLIPRQPTEMMPAIWSLCDVAIVPLRDNPVFATVIPSKIFEAMGMGIPILMSLPKGEATGIVGEAGAGICVRPEDPKALADAIVRLADDRQLQIELRRNGLKSSKKNSREELAARMIDLIRECTA